MSAFTAPINRKEGRSYGRATHWYVDANGLKVPGVTTLIGNGLPKPALVGWGIKSVAEYAVSAVAATKVERVDAPPAPELDQDEPPLDDEPLAVEDTLSREQMTKIAAQMGDLGITDRDDALAYVAEVIGREVETRNELTRAEASRLIEHMALALG